MPYVVRRSPERLRVQARGLEFQLYRWRGADPQPVVLLHGWGDAGETWQFLVDCLDEQRTYVAMDLRGFGRSQRSLEGYWFPDYLADLEALLDQLAPEGAVDLIGHSMGGNIAMLYAGARPQRVRRLVNVESFGLPRTDPAEAPARYARWLDELRRPAAFTSYDDFGQFADVLARRNPRTPRERLEFIARVWAREHAARIELWADPRHKHTNPVLYQRDQAEACWRAMQAPILFVMGGRSEIVQRAGDALSLDALRSIFTDVALVMLEDAGHMLHHEAPEALAQAIEQFMC